MARHFVGSQVETALRRPARARFARQIRDFVPRRATV